MRYRQMAAGVAVLMLVSSLLGCAAQNVAGQWRNEAIVANGSDKEWTGGPQYYDPHRQLAVRVVNDSASLSLCVSTADPSLQRQLGMAGLSVWVDPEGGQTKVFGIHLPGGPPPADGQDRPQGTDPQRPSVEAPHHLAITYADATGPLAMDMAEVRKTGINIGVGQPEGHRLVYEFRIAFKAAPSLEAFAPGMLVGIAIQGGGSEPDDRQRASTEERMGSGGPGGGMGGPGPGGRGGGRGGPPWAEKGDNVDLWLKVQLADRVSG